MSGFRINKSTRFVRVGLRLFKVVWWMDAGCIRGKVTPFIPWHKRRKPTVRILMTRKSHETINHFKMSMSSFPFPYAEVQRISVVHRKQRNGWGSDMVVALIKVFPDSKWSISAPNEKSKGMFNKLADLYPENVIRHK